MFEHGIQRRHVILACILLGLGLLAVQVASRVAVSPEGRVAVRRFAWGPHDMWEDEEVCYGRVDIVGGASSIPVATHPRKCGTWGLLLAERLSWEGTSWRLASKEATFYDFGGKSLASGGPDPKRVPPARPLSPELRRRLARLPEEIQARLPSREVRLTGPGPSGLRPLQSSERWTDDWVNDDPDVLVVVDERFNLGRIYSRGPVLLTGMSTAFAVYSSSWVLFDDKAELQQKVRAARVFAARPGARSWSTWKRGERTPEVIPSIIPQAQRTEHPPARPMTDEERRRLRRFGFPEEPLARLRVVELRGDFTSRTNNQRDIEIEDPDVLVVLGPSFSASGKIRARGPVLFLGEALNSGPVESGSWVMVDDCANANLPLRGERVVVNERNASRLIPDSMEERQWPMPPGCSQEETGPPVEVTAAAGLSPAP